MRCFKLDPSHLSKVLDEHIKCDQDESNEEGTGQGEDESAAAAAIAEAVAEAALLDDESLEGRDDSRVMLLPLLLQHDCKVCASLNPWLWFTHFSPGGCAWLL